MRTITTILKTFDELSETEKRKAYSNNYYKIDVDISDEINTLKRFCEIFDISIRDYYVDAYSYNFNVLDYGTHAQHCDGMKPERLSKYVNNHLNQIYNRFTKKFVSLREACENCALTGFCADYEILEPLADCANYKKYDSFEAIIDNCLNNIFTTCRESCEYQNSYEYFEEMATINEWEFDPNGILK